MATEITKSITDSIQPLTIDRAMVALKNGETDDALLSYVNFLANRISIKSLQFLHVLQKGSFAFTHLGKEAKALLDTLNIKAEVAENIQIAVESIIPKKEHRTVEILVKEGYPLEELIYRAKLNAADLVVIGQDTEQIHHNILARNFLRKVSANALVIPDKATPKLNNILVPIDFSTHSLKALQTAVAINKALAQPIKITCVNIYELPNLTFYNAEKTKAVLKDIIEKDRQLALTHFLQRQVPAIKDRKYIQTVLVEKDCFDIGYQIHEYANTNHHDLIIMGAKGHSKAALLMIGSVTERILGLTENRPVLVVK